MPFRHYRKNYLENVIFQLRFPVILKLESGGPADLQEAFRTRFPVLREGSEMLIEVLMSPEGSKAEKRTPRPRWLFFANDESKSVTIASNLFSLEYKKFVDVLEALDDFSFCWGEFRKRYPVDRVDRIGVRYVDNVALPAGDPLDWDGYLHEDLIAAATGVGIPAGHSMLRSMHALYVGAEDHRITFQFGVNNQDFPNPVAKRAFILDYDCSSIGPVDVGDVETTVHRYNEMIHDLFETHIGERLRQDMVAVEDRPTAE